MLVSTSLTVAAVYRVSVQFHTGVGFTVVAIRNHHPYHGPNAFITLSPTALVVTVVGPQGPKPFLFITGSRFLFKSGILGKNFPFYFIMSWLPDMIDRT